MSEKYKPSAEEMREAEESMTKGQKSASKEREETYKAGREHGREEILNRVEGIKETIETGLADEKYYDGVAIVDHSIKTKIENDKYFEELKDIAIKCGLSKEAEDVLLEKKVIYTTKTGQFKIEENVEEETLLELVGRLPIIKEYVSVNPDISERTVVEKIRKRFPKAKINIISVISTRY